MGVVVRPKEGERIDIRIPQELIDAIDRAAKQAGIGRPEMIRRILNDWRTK